MQDGDPVTQETNENPIQPPGELDVTKNEESDPIKLAIRAQAGWKTAGDTVILPTGPAAHKWAVGGVESDFEEYGQPLVISAVIEDQNVIFWAKARADDREKPAKDSSVSFQVGAVMEEAD